MFHNDEFSQWQLFSMARFSFTEPAVCSANFLSLAFRDIKLNFMNPQQQQTPTLSLTDTIFTTIIMAITGVAIGRLAQPLCEVLAPLHNITMAVLQSARQLFAVFGRPEILFLSYTVAFAMIAFSFNNFWTRPRPRSTVILPLNICQALLLGYGSSFLWMAHVTLLKISFCDGTECSIFYAAAALPFTVFIHLWLGIGKYGCHTKSGFY